MELEYNDVQLELLNLHRVERTGVYSPDGVDLLYINWVIGATCVYSPGGYPVGTAALELSQPVQDEVRGIVKQPADLIRGAPPVFKNVKQETNTPPRRYGFNAALTDAELRTRLWMPRGKLKITALDGNGNRIIWLQSPREGFTTDVTNGPRPLSVDIIESAGEGTTFGVHFQIQTTTTPCPGGSDKLILSHRWEMSHDEDEDYYLTRIIQGEIVFNAAAIHAIPLFNNQNIPGFNPDWLRGQLFHPIPLGFRRLGPKVTLSPDGLTLHYLIRDVNPKITFDPGDSGATQISIIENLGYSQNHRLF